VDAKLQRRVQRYGWDKAASAYERYWHSQLWPAQERLLALAAIQPGEHVLDVACGTGLVTFKAADAAGAAGRVMGTDISAAMVDLLSAEATRRELTNVTAERRDAEQAGLDDQTFDVALCALGLMYVPDPVAALREMHRVLKPGGRAVAAVWGARAQCGWAEIFPIVDARVQSDVCPMFFQLGTGEALAASFRAAGFNNVATERISATLHYDSAADAAGAAFDGGPVALAVSRFDESTRATAEAEYLASIAPWQSDSGYDVPGEFVIVRGDQAVLLSGPLHREGRGARA
jgi:ubiquinone/menaquinone biosynthesis C-methylase UbiE